MVKWSLIGGAILSALLYGFTYAAVQYWYATAIALAIGIIAGVAVSAHQIVQQGNGSGEEGSQTGENS